MCSKHVVRTRTIPRFVVDCLVPAFALTLFSATSSAQQTLTFSSAGSAQQIPATLFKPEGNGPFPAVVMVHDCSGLGPRSSGTPARWTRELLQQGYVVLIPDSFSPRGINDGVCTMQDANLRNSVGGPVRAADAYGALRALRELSYVDKKRIGIMGNSHGGWTTLEAMVAPVYAGDPLTDAKRSGFAAAIALYPRCTTTMGEWSTTTRGRTGPMSGYRGVYRTIAPLLILAGELDDWTPAEPCRIMAEVARAHGQPVDAQIYPGAHHAFDSDAPLRFVAQRNNPSSPTGRGATTAGNPQAWADARKRVAEFFGRHLKF
jgi:dienelactone hydrolase